MSLWFAPCSSIGKPLSAIASNSSRLQTILVVEDIADTRDLWALAFRKAGYHVVVADSCAAALDVLRKEGKRIDFVVTDYWLGDGYCEAMLRDAVAKGDLQTGKALICTAFRSVQNSSYAARVLYKPIVGAELVARVGEILASAGRS